MTLNISTKFINEFVSEKEIKSLENDAISALNKVKEKNGEGSDFLGWYNLPLSYDKEELCRIKIAAKKIRENSDILVVIGIGGSYLGARAAIEFIKSPLYNNLKKDTPDIYFAGNNISPTALNELLSICEGKDISLNVISKSGTTTEPAIAFRLLRNALENKYGKQEAKVRIVAITDESKGALRRMCSLSKAL